MIPHRMPGNEIFGHGLKGRVTACRKRLRVNRSVHRVHLNYEPVAFDGEPTGAFLDEYCAVGESSVSRRDAAEFRDGEAWQSVEQEVGIT